MIEVGSVWRCGCEPGCTTTAEVLNQGRFFHEPDKTLVLYRASFFQDGEIGCCFESDFRERFPEPLRMEQNPGVALADIILETTRLCDRLDIQFCYSFLAPQIESPMVGGRLGSVQEADILISGLHDLRDAVGGNGPDRIKTAKSFEQMEAYLDTIMRQGRS